MGSEGCKSVEKHHTREKWELLLFNYIRSYSDKFLLKKQNQFETQNMKFDETIILLQEIISFTKPKLAADSLIKDHRSWIPNAISVQTKTKELNESFNLFFFAVLCKKPFIYAVTYCLILPWVPPGPVKFQWKGWINIRKGTGLLFAREGWSFWSLFSRYTSSPLLGFCFPWLHLLTINHLPKVLTGKSRNKQFTRFKLCAILSSMNGTLYLPARDMNHPLSSISTDVHAAHLSATS